MSQGNARGDFLISDFSVSDVVCMRVYRNTNQMFTTGVRALISWSGADIDSESGFDPANPTRIPCIIAGEYCILTYARWAANAAAGKLRELTPQNKLGQDVGWSSEGSDTSGQETECFSWGAIKTVAGDWVQVRALQNSGVDLNLVEAWCAIFIPPGYED